MSAGSFDLEGKYESDSGNVYACRPQPESAELTLDGTANAYPAGDVDGDLGTLTLRKTRRSFGVVPRTVTVRFTADPGGPQADYLGEGSTLSIPVFTPAAYAAYGLGQTGTYLGTAVSFVSKSPELVR